MLAPLKPCPVTWAGAGGTGTVPLRRLRRTVHSVSSWNFAALPAAMSMSRWSRLADPGPPWASARRVGRSRLADWLSWPILVR